MAILNGELAVKAVRPIKIVNIVAIFVLNGELAVKAVRRIATIPTARETKLNGELAVKAVRPLKELLALILTSIEWGIGR